ncbi:MAG: AAA family ATPase [Coxiellaceae bacterium]|jgi:MSHA biogenesis protein MshM|nr:AAA family ATPase [Coxiellaceae bacterium]
MYLKHFGFNEFPFSLTPNLRFFCSLHAYKEALNVIMVSLYNGEGFIKITGEVGTGKTMLCRKLLSILGNEYIAVYIANATLDTLGLQKTIAQELGITIHNDIDTHQLLNLLTAKLVTLHNLGNRIVIIIDEAHALSDQTLEGLRLLSNLETADKKLMQFVLVGQPELNLKLKKIHLRQLEQRIIFSYNLPKLHNRNQLLSYLCAHLATAGYKNTYDTLFSTQAVKLLLKASRGIPRLINILGHKAFLITYGYNEKKVDAKAIKMAIADTESTFHPTIALAKYSSLKIVLAFLLLITILGICGYFIIN